MKIPMCLKNDRNRWPLLQTRENVFVKITQCDEVEQDLICCAERVEQSWIEIVNPERFHLSTSTGLRSSDFFCSQPSTRLLDARSLKKNLFCPLRVVIERRISLVLLYKSMQVTCAPPFKIPTFARLNTVDLKAIIVLSEMFNLGTFIGHGAGAKTKGRRWPINTAGGKSRDILTYSFVWTYASTFWPHVHQDSWLNRLGQPCRNVADGASKFTNLFPKLLIYQVLPQTLKPFCFANIKHSQNVIVQSKYWLQLHQYI